MATMVQVTPIEYHTFLVNMASAFTNVIEEGVQRGRETPYVQVRLPGEQEVIAATQLTELCSSAVEVLYELSHLVYSGYLPWRDEADTQSPEDKPVVHTPSSVFEFGLEGVDRQNYPRIIPMKRVHTMTFDNMIREVENKLGHPLRRIYNFIDVHVVNECIVYHEQTIAQDFGVGSGNGRLGGRTCLISSVLEKLCYQ